MVHLTFDGKRTNKEGRKWRRETNEEARHENEGVKGRPPEGVGAEETRLCNTRARTGLGEGQMTFYLIG